MRFWSRLALVLVLVSVTGSETLSFIGNIRVKGLALPCAVACGGSRGIVNPNFLGDGVNNLLVGPSIENFEQAANRSVDRAMQLLDGVLTGQRKAFMEDLNRLATAQRTALIEQLDTISREAISALDETLRARIEDVDQRTTLQIGSLETTLEKQIGVFSYSIARVFIFAAVLFGMGYLVWRIYVSVILAGHPWVVMIRPTLWGIGFVAAFAGAAQAYAVWSERSARKAVIARYERGYNEAFSNINLHRAVSYANQLYVFDPSDRLAAARDGKTRLLRDVFARPALYRTNESGNALKRLADAQADFLHGTGKPDLDLTILVGFLSWQQGNDRFSEYMAACAFATALERHQREGGEAVTLLLPFAEYYLRSYLVNPLPDEVVSSLFEQNGVAKANVFGPVRASSDDALDTPIVAKHYRVSELAAIVSKTKTMLDLFAKKLPFYDHAKINWQTVQAYRSIVSGYAELVRLGGVLAIADVANKQDIRKRIRLAAGGIVAAFDRYLDFLEKTEFDDNTAKLNTFKGVWPLYTRARAAMKLGENADTWDAVDEKEGIHHRWLTNVVQPQVRATTFKLITLSTESDFSSLQPKLAFFEGMVRAMFAEEKLDRARPCHDTMIIGCSLQDMFMSSPSRTTAAAWATDLGIFGCAANDWEWFQPDDKIICAGENSRPRPFAVFALHSQFPVHQIENNIELRDALLRNRTIPAF